MTHPAWTRLSISPSSKEAGASFVNLAGISAGPSDEAAQTVTFSVSSNNPSLFSSLAVDTSTGIPSLVIAPATNANSSALVTVTATDDGGTANGGVDSFSRQFTVIVTAVNDAPTLGAILDVTVLEDASANLLLGGINAGPSNESAQTVTLSVSSDDPLLFSSLAIGPPSSGTATLGFTPVPNVSGQATLTVTVTDDGGTTNGGVNSFSRQFRVTITSVNDAPAFDTVTDTTVDEGSAQTNLSVTGIQGGPLDEAGQVVTLSVSSNNPGLFEALSVGAPSGGVATLSFTPALNANGSAIATLTATDDQGTANGGADTFSRQFTIGVSALNDAPTFDALSDLHRGPEQLGSERRRHEHRARPGQRGESNGDHVGLLEQSVAFLVAEHRPAFGHNGGARVHSRLRRDRDRGGDGDRDRSIWLTSISRLLK